MIVAVFQIFGVLILSNKARAIYENNPFFKGENGLSTVTSLPPAVIIHPTPNLTLSEEITKEHLFTTEPPGVLYGGNLNRFCLQPKGQFPSSSCDKYVNCWEGVATEQTCPPGFLFNPTKLYCDFARNVDCQDRPVLQNSTPAPMVSLSDVISSSPNYEDASSPQAPNPSLRSFCLRSTGLFPGSTCSKFVNCWDNNAVEQDCPAGLYFSSHGYCDYPKNVACDRERVEDIAARKDAKDSECPLEFGNFRDKHNCSQYFSCAYYKVAAKYSCSEGLSFSDILGVCDYSYRVGCSKEPQIYQKNVLNNNVAENNALSSNVFAHPDLSKPANIGDSRCIVASGLVRDKDNCSSYYVCELGKVVASYVCPPGYKFSNELGVCDHEAKVNCDNLSRIYDPTVNTLYVPDIPKELLIKIQNCQPGAVFRLNPQCTSACRCRNGSAEIIKCSPGLSYDSLLDKCLPVHLARC